ncbi:MAG: polysaccharide deacetylase family protein, partial [Bacillota bacterium]
TSTVHDGPAAPFDPAVLTYLNWDEVQEMARSGLVDFQSHTDNLHQTGPDGTPLTLSLPAPEVLADLTRANQIIETKTGQQVLALAYPYGRYTQELERLAHEAGYKLGFTITEGFTRPLENALAVKRFILFMDDTPGRLAERFPDH